MVEVVQKLSEKILAAIQTGNLQPVDSLISNNAVFVHMGVCLDKKVNLKLLRRAQLQLKRWMLLKKKRFLAEQQPLFLENCN